MTKAIINLEYKNLKIIWFRLQKKMHKGFVGSLTHWMFFTLIVVSLPMWHIFAALANPHLPLLQSLKTTNDWFRVLKLGKLTKVHLGRSPTCFSFQNTPLFPFHAWLGQPIYCRTVQRVPRSEDPSHLLFALRKVAQSQNNLQPFGGEDKMWDVFWKKLFRPLFLITRYTVWKVMPFLSCPKITQVPLTPPYGWAEPAVWSKMVRLNVAHNQYGSLVKTFSQFLFAM